MHYVWLDWGGEGDKHPGRMREREPKHRGKTPKRVARRIARVGQSSDRGKNTYGVARPGSRGGENKETPKRGPRQNAKACSAAVRLALYRGVLRLRGK